MTDILERCAKAKEIECGDYYHFFCGCQVELYEIIDAAAAEIVRLRERVRELEDALHIDLVSEYLDDWYGVLVGVEQIGDQYTRDYREKVLELRDKIRAIPFSEDSTDEVKNER